MIGPFRHTISRHDFVIPQTSTSMYCCDLDALPCLAAPQSAKDKSAMFGLSTRLPSLRRYTAARLTSAWHVISFFWHTILTIPAGCCSVCGTHFDLLTTAFMLTCCTRSLVACLRPMVRKQLWMFSTSAPLRPLLSYSRFPLSAARTWHEATRVQEIQPPALGWLSPQPAST